MRCCVLCLFNLHKQAAFKLRAVEYAISFFSISYLCFIGFSQKFYEKFEMFISKCRKLQIIRMSNLATLRWQPFG